MKAAVITFPGSNCDRDLAVAFEKAGFQVARVWHKDTALPEGTDVVGVPGGFSYGDYLRCGAMAAQSPIMQAVKKAANDGVAVVGICNGFQILCEAGLLPGALLRNAGLKYVCKPISLTVANGQTRFTAGYQGQREVVMTQGNGDGNFFADAETLARIEGEGQVVFRYVDNPNGSVNAIAGIQNARGNVLGMMPHPERVVEQAHGNQDGRKLFEGLLNVLA